MNKGRSTGNLNRHLSKTNASKQNYAIRMGYEKLKEYYAKTDDSFIYPIATSRYFMLLYLLFA